MKKLLFYFIFLTLTGCLKISITGNNSDSKITETIEECPEQPSQILSKKNVENIVLTNELLEQSGQVNAKKMIGYTFNATSGQEFTYETNDDICVWLYAPDTKLITDNKLTQTGKYIVQIGTIKGSKSFNINLGLDAQKIANSTPPITAKPTPQYTPQATVQPTPQYTPQATAQPTKNAIYRPSPEDFARGYYSTINQQEYSQGWNKLSSSLQNNTKLHPEGYSSYLNWWKTVNYVEVNNVNTVSQTDYEAIVNISLAYNMNNGQRSPHSLQFYLIWDDNNSQWLLNKTKRL